MAPLDWLSKRHRHYHNSNNSVRRHVYDTQPPQLVLNQIRIITRELNNKSQGNGISMNSPKTFNSIPSIQYASLSRSYIIGKPFLAMLCIKSLSVCISFPLCLDVCLCVSFSMYSFRARYPCRLVSAQSALPNPDCLRASLPIVPLNPKQNRLEVTRYLRKDNRPLDSSCRPR